MAIKPWKRFFGLQESRWAGRDPARRPLPEDCNTVLTPPALRAAGVTNVPRARKSIELDGRFHHWDVELPDGTVVKAPHQTSLDWLVGVMSSEDRARSQANLKGQVLETFVTKPRGEPFVAKIWRVPIAPPQRPPTPLREVRRRSGSRLEREADRAAVPWNDHELDSALLDMLCSDALRLLNATDAPLRRGDLAAELGLEHSREDRLALAKVLYRLKAEGYHVAP